MAQEIAKAIFAKHTAKKRERDWQEYLKFAKEKGRTTVSKNIFFKRNYGINAPKSKYPLVRYAEETGQPNIEEQGLTEEELKKFR